MSGLFTLVIAIFPVYFILGYVYNKDNKKEPKQLLKLLFILGMVSCIPAALIELFLGDILIDLKVKNLASLFIYISVTIALVEEALKWLITFRLTYNNKHFDQLYDAIVYSVYVSLGFACFENILYVLDTGIWTGVIRALTAVPAHAADAILMGTYLGLAKQAEKMGDFKLQRKLLFFSLFMPTMIHAIYDYCLMAELMVLIGVFIVYVIFLYIYSIKKIKNFSSHNDDF